MKTATVLLMEGFDQAALKNKDTAGILALFLGGIGAHRFYLGQTGLGILYIFLGFISAFVVPVILGVIDAIIFFSMDKDAFDIKHNRDYFRAVRSDTDFERRQYEYRRRKQREEERPDFQRRAVEQYRRPKPRRDNPHKNAGVQLFRDYDYDGAIAEFKKALEIEPKDIATHFNLACAYSLNEKAEEAFHHLDQAVALGFDDFNRIQNHDALAYLRIQPAFESFKEQGYRLAKPLDAPPPDEENLLEQLKKLGELKEKGLLTEEEFAVQKKKLLD